MARLTIDDIRRRKGMQKIAMLTCYDYSFAGIIDNSGVDVVLVGDSLANVVLGIKETRKVSIGEMLHHTKAVARAVSKSLVVADMPYASYQRNPKKASVYAKKFIDAGADAVKVEWFSQKKGKVCEFVISSIIKQGISVMGHIGLTPQTAHLLGGYKVQGRDKSSAKDLLAQAKILQDLGVFSVVLECIPYELARTITARIKIPTIGIGAGRFCDGQVLVLYDMLGIFRPKNPRKFVRVYADLGKHIGKAVSQYSSDVRMNRFPSLKESFIGS